MKENVLNDGKVKAALVKKALGYDATEIVEEYVTCDEGDVKLSKKKVTKKNVPPDMTALKMLIEEDSAPVFEMSDEELQAEMNRLLLLLEKTKKKKENKIEKTPDGFEQKPKKRKRQV